MSFYENFVLLCEKKGVKPGRAATECGINRSNVTNWKNNGYTPRGDVLQKLATYFDVSVGVLLGDDEDVTGNLVFAGRDVLDDVDVAFYGAFRELDEEQKETVRDMVRVMRERRSKK